MKYILQVGVLPADPKKAMTFAFVVPDFESPGGWAVSEDSDSSRAHKFDSREGVWDAVRQILITFRYPDYKRFCSFVAYPQAE